MWTMIAIIVPPILMYINEYSAKIVTPTARPVTPATIPRLSEALQRGHRCTASQAVRVRMGGHVLYQMWFQCHIMLACLLSLCALSSLYLFSI